MIRPFDRKGLGAKLAATGARWRMDRPTRAKGKRTVHALGYVPHRDEPSGQLREILSHNHLLAYRASEDPATYPQSYDWRNVSGGDFVTPAGDQGECNACVAFATLGVVEAMVRIARRNAGLQISLSEAHLFFCQGSSSGATCGTGWNPTSALTALLANGVVDDACFPYSAHDQPCALCPDWQNRLTNITDWHTLYTTTAMKQWISSKGPLITGFNLYQDFRDFWKVGQGVYHHVAGAAEGMHTVCCIGYDDPKQHWICKNSWGANGGPSQDGTFCISYGDSGIDATMWSIDGIQ